jgi:glycosyltransferase involved in cell wall biosynthesis
MSRPIRNKGRAEDEEAVPFNFRFRRRGTFHEWRWGAVQAQMPLSRYPLAEGGYRMRISVILPAKNEAESLRQTLPALWAAFPNAEVIVVDDGSTDATATVASACGARVLRSPYSMGNGAAIKRGARDATGDVLVFMDADGQHDPNLIPLLLRKLEDGFDMVVGARNASGQANKGRGAANAFYNRLASWMTGHHVADLTSGFRAVRADKFREFLHLLPNGFSYPTTSTMAFFRSAYPVAYVPIPVADQVVSH